MVKCKCGCGKNVLVVSGKVQRQFYSDKCRKTSKRAELKESKAPTCPVVDEPRTDGIKPPTSDTNPGQFPKTARFPTHKRGKDIKCFADLPPDVQQTIDSMSLVDGKIDQTIKANRTAIAVNYQHLFAGAYYPHGAVCTDIMKASERASYKPASELGPGEFNHVSKPGDADYVGVMAEPRIG